MGRYVAWVVAATGLAAFATGGCALPSEDSARFKEPIPQNGDVAMGVPKSSGGTVSGQATTGLRIQSNGSLTSSAPYSGAYTFTRNITDGIDLGTGLVLGLVWAIVNQPPTTVNANSAVWGPGSGDALDPVVWRFTATDIGNHEYNYELDGRPKASTSESDWVAVIQGHGYGKDRPEHRSGWFQVNQDGFNSLDTQREHDSGTVKVTYDLRTPPRTIDAEIKTNDGSGAFVTANVTHNDDGGGALAITGSVDLNPLTDAQLESIQEHSAWNSSGAGRADLSVSGGDVPPQLGVVTASECWSSAFATTYYTDSADWKPTSGDASTCAFPAATF